MDFRKIFSFIPKNENVVLHIRIKELNKKINNYKKTSKILISYFQKNFKTILVPAFTYSFCKNRNINLKSQNSETGRFSEEIRKIYKNKRTLDPIFSFIIVKGKPGLKKKVSHTAFDDKSIFKKIYEKNFLIINIGLKDIVSTQFHKIEFDQKVPYRYNKIFKGKLNKKTITYNYFVRDRRYSLNRKKILHDLLKKKIVKELKLEKIKIRYFKTKPFTDFLNSRVSKNKYYLVKKGK